jgi:hypothetical protein
MERSTTSLQAKQQAERAAKFRAGVSSLKKAVHNLKEHTKIEDIKNASVFRLMKIFSFVHNSLGLPRWFLAHCNRYEAMEKLVANYDPEYPSLWREWMPEDLRSHVVLEHALVQFVEKYQYRNVENRGQLRVLIFQFVSHRNFDRLITLCIIANTVLLAMPYHGAPWCKATSSLKPIRHDQIL